MSIEYESELFRWGLLWRQENKLDGKTEYLIRTYKHLSSEPLLFKNRWKARQYKKENYSYVNAYKAEPHGWKPVQVVKVKVSYLVWG